MQSGNAYGSRDYHPGPGRQMIMPEFSPCPACGAIAEITDRFVLASTDGPVDHLALSCAAGHHFRMPADSRPADGRAAGATWSGRPVAARL
jgi:hypothetical protein